MWLKHPRTGIADPMLTIVFVAVCVASIRFLLDSTTIIAGTFSFTIAKLDALTYSSFLAPILGAHSWQNTRPNTMNAIDTKGHVNVDNPDQN